MGNAASTQWAWEHQGEGGWVPKPVAKAAPKRPLFRALTPPLSRSPSPSRRRSASPRKPARGAKPAGRK